MYSYYQLLLAEKGNLWRKSPAIFISDQRLMKMQEHTVKEVLGMFKLTGVWMGS